jgi:alpha-beta hydrolase superfamily lysophospholipase
MSDAMMTIGRVQVRRRPAQNPRPCRRAFASYGEHIGRYDHVAEALVARLDVTGRDHVGHGRSEGEAAVVEDFETVVDDVRAALYDVGGEYRRNM